MNKELMEQFHAEMVGIYNESKKIGYTPHRFGEMLGVYGGFETAKRLIKDETTGFAELYLRQRLDLTVEAHVLKSEFNALFTDEERGICIRRLIKNNCAIRFPYEV